MFRGLLIALILLLSPSLAGAQSAAAERLRWAHEGSDLSPDPRVVYGTLPNGMRYALSRNLKPAGQVSMRLIVLAGSMNERPDQAGVAHVIEHMAFRGTKSFPDGEAKLALERLGLRVGQSVNAGTSSASTIYTLDAPRSDAASVDTLLTLLSEIADGLTLDGAALASEREIIRAEAASRRPAMQAAQLALLAHRLGDHPAALSPIGRPGVVERVTPQDLRAFYRAWYRPERAILVIVGDIDTAELAGKIETRFGGWRGDGPAPADPPPTGPGPEAKGRVALDVGLLGAQLELYWPKPYRPAARTRAEVIRRFQEVIGQQASTGRVRELSDVPNRPFGIANGLREEDTPFVGAGVVIDASSVSDVPGSVSLLAGALRQIQADGFTQAEVDRAVTMGLAGMRRWNQASASAGNGEIAGDITRTALTGEVLLSRQTSLALYEEAVRDLSAERVSALFRDMLPNGKPRMFFAGAPEFGVDAAMLDVAWTRAASAAVGKFAERPAKPWPYTDFGRPGEVRERRALPAAGATLVRFRNGVRLTVRPSGDAKGVAYVSVRFGLGRLETPRDGLYAADFATLLLSTGGLEGVPPTDWPKMFAGRPVAVIATRSDDAFELSNAPIGVSTENLGLQMQALAAYVVAPGWDPREWPNFIRTMAQAEAGDEIAPLPLYLRRAPVLLHSGDLRWAPSTAAMARTWRPQDARAFLEPFLKSAPLEVIIVGDVSLEDAIEATAKTFGALPPRPKRPEPRGLRDVKFPVPTPTPIIVRHKGSAASATAVVNWSATDALASPKGTRAIEVLTDVMRSRAFDEIRVRLGASYSPRAWAELSTTFPGYGFIHMSVGTTPERAPEMLAVFDAIAADLATRPLSADEFARAVQPRIEAERRARDSNFFWLTQLAGAQQSTRRLDYGLSGVSDLESLTPADLQAAAKRWLVKERRWQMLLLPQPAAGQTAE